MCTIVSTGKVKIHFDEWTCKYDYWTGTETVDLHPVGWCERNGWELQKPGTQKQITIPMNTFPCLGANFYGSGQIFVPMKKFLS